MVDEALDQYDQLNPSGQATPIKDPKATAKALRKKELSPFEVYQEELKDKRSVKKLPGTDTI